MYTVRKMKKHEHYFFLEMLYESIFIPENKPSMEELLNEPNLLKYTENWGRPGDEVLVAVDVKEELIGAVWYRLFAKDEQGYGFVDEYTPELGIAIKEEVRGKGIGTLLLSEIIKLAKEQQYTTLSLSVDPENKAAVGLYKKFGFNNEGSSGTSITMICYVNESFELIDNLNKPLPKQKKVEKVPKCWMIIGLVGIVASVLLYGMTMVAASIYSTTLTEWFTERGKFGTALLEIGVFPLLLSASLFIGGLLMIIVYLIDLKKTNL